MSERYFQIHVDKNSGNSTPKFGMEKLRWKHVSKSNGKAVLFVLFIYM